MANDLKIRSISISVVKLEIKHTYGHTQRYYSNNNWHIKLHEMITFNPLEPTITNNKLQ